MAGIIIIGVVVYYQLFSIDLQTLVMDLILKFEVHFELVFF